MTATMTTSLVPEELPDFLEGIIVVHGAMRRDAGRLPLAAGTVTNADGARALQRWFARFAREVEHHHQREDDVVWPMLVEGESPNAASPSTRPWPAPRLR